MLHWMTPATIQIGTTPMGLRGLLKKRGTFKDAMFNEETRFSLGHCQHIKGEKHCLPFLRWTENLAMIWEKSLLTQDVVVGGGGY